MHCRERPNESVYSTLKKRQESQSVTIDYENTIKSNLVVEFHTILHHFLDVGRSLVLLESLSQYPHFVVVEEKPASV